MFETSDLNTIKTLLANKPESVRLLEVDDNSISKRIKDIKKIAIEKKLKIEIKKFKNPNMFMPFRWNKDLENSYYDLTFNQGPQICPGRNLAIALLQSYIIIYLKRFKFNLRKNIEFF